jgi:ATP/maltotriose-dependent transcriptional regulator MalT/DNA-binding SARP family transcriptional activator
MDRPDRGPSRPPTQRLAPGSLLARPRLEQRLDELRSRRLAIVLGGAGYGKSTLVAAWAATATDIATAWCELDPGARELRRLVERTTRAIVRQVPDLSSDVLLAVDSATTDDAADGVARAEAFAALLCEALETHPTPPLALVFDDLHEIADAEPALRFVEALVRGAPPDLHLVLTSRRPVGFPIERLRGQGQVVEIAGDMLPFDRSEVRSLLGQLRPTAVDVCDDVIGVTGGWPALTRLVIESIRYADPADRSRSIARMVEPEGPLISYIAEEVLGRETPATLDVLRVACRFDRVNPELLHAVGLGAAGAILEDLARRAFFVEGRFDGGERWYVVHGLVRDFVQGRLPLDSGETRRIHRAAAAWLDDRSRYADALRQLLLAEDRDTLAARLAERGFELVRTGSLDVVVDAVRSIPEDERTRQLETILGDALLRRGEFDAALAALGRAGADVTPLPAALAWRIGVIQHERGNVDDALATFSRADLEHGAADDLALVAAWRAIAYWQRHDREGCRPWAAFALEVAERSGDDRAMACALASVGALAHLDGDLHKSIDSFRQAVAAAERAADILLQVRFRTDLGYVLVIEGHYRDGLLELDHAVRLAGGLGHSTFLALALADRGQAHLGLGHLEEAGADFGSARDLFERIGSHWVSYAVFREANLHRLRGELRAARARYEDVIADAARISQPWFLADAMIGLAATVVEDDPDEALRIIDRALPWKTEPEPASPYLGGARVALAAGRLDVAERLVSHAFSLAEGTHDRPSLAGALEVRAQLEGDPARARALLDEAESLWRETGSPYGFARHELVRAAVIGGTEGRAAALHAADSFREMGARRMADTATILAGNLEAAVRPPVQIRSLGAFQVLREGEPVGVGEWQSRKARELLKVLMTRRGRSTTRDQLCEILWPEEDPGPLLNRLSVALTTIRAVLDPGRRHAADHFIRADNTTVSLDLRNVDVDIESFLAAAADVRRSLAAGGDASSRATLVAVEAAYGGDFLEENPYDEWAVPLREEVRAAYLMVARALARHASAEGDADNAVRLYLRILEQDPFDEDGHLGLVRTLARAGRHGEARRRYRVYTARMAELDLEAAPYPAASPSHGARPGGGTTATLSSA